MAPNPRHYMDQLTTPLNACSVETIPVPIALADGTEVWPLMLSCYQLEPADNDDARADVDNGGVDGGSIQDERQNQRRHKLEEQRLGCMRLYMVKVPDIAGSYLSRMLLQFGRPTTVLDGRKRLMRRSDRGGEDDDDDIDVVAFTHGGDAAKSTPRRAAAVNERVTTGILDGQWFQLPSSDPTRRKRKNHPYQFHQWAFASAHATGEIQIHALQVPVLPEKNANDGDYHQQDDDYEDVKDEVDESTQSTPSSSLPIFASGSSYSVVFLGKSDPPTVSSSLLSSIQSTSLSMRPPPLCLSLSWDRNWYDGSSRISFTSPSFLSRIVSTYSNGCVALYDVVALPTNSSINSNSMDDSTNDGCCDRVQIIERESWQAHSMFQSPVEVWSGCFASDASNTVNSQQDSLDSHEENHPQHLSSNVILTGGDEGKLKLWDIRCTNRPSQMYEPFMAGVTCLSPHPRFPHLVACGSYDETLCIYDLRQVHASGQNKKNNNIARLQLCHTDSLGGGIWRIKWHPYTDHRLLVAAMHGGCRVIQLQGLMQVEAAAGLATESTTTSVYTPPSITATSQSTDGIVVKELITKEFTEHESMAYGADWLVCRHPNHAESYFEAAASCSFYDRTAFLWDSVI